MTEEPSRVHKLANAIVNKFAKNKLRQAYQDVEKERLNMGCGCRRCAHNAVREVNGWVDWIAEPTHPVEYRNQLKYRVEERKRGKFRIVQGIDNEDEEDYDEFNTGL